MRILPVLIMLGSSLSGCGGPSMAEPPERIVYLAIGASDVAGVDADPITLGYGRRLTESGRGLQ